uniref:Putative secreted protein n=1 Tax=Ixodes ricinus TaxID=34613 RepID=V5HWV1_IXORI
MKIFLVVLLVAVLSYLEGADSTDCRVGEHPKACNSWNNRNTSCFEGTCYNPTPLPCEECYCYEDDGEVCESKMCLVEAETLRLESGECREPYRLPKRLSWYFEDARRKKGNNTSRINVQYAADNFTKW